MARARQRRAKQPKQVETFTHDERRTNIPNAEDRALMTGTCLQSRSPTNERNPDLDPQLVWRGKSDAPLEVSGAAALHPGAGPSQGVDRRPDAAHRAAHRRRRPVGLLRRLQRPARGRRPDRVLRARLELVEPHDPRRLLAGDGLAGRTRRTCAARSSASTSTHPTEPSSTPTSSGQRRAPLSRDGKTRAHYS